MRATLKLLRALALIFFSLGPAPLFAAHPLLTEDTGTQGAGQYQLEITHDLSTTRGSGTKNRDRLINNVLSIGLADNIDLVATLPYERLSNSDSTVAGFADLELAAKWRFYEEGGQSLALRPGIELPSSNKNNGSSADRVTPNLFIVSSYVSDPWAFHAHLGYSNNPTGDNTLRNHIYHSSVAVEHRFSDRIRVVSDVSLETNTERSGARQVGSMVIGLIYSISTNLDFDLGYRKGLTRAAPDFAWLTGLALRF